MSKIVVIVDGLVQQEVDVDKSRVNIGRRAGNDIVIDHLTVSGQHAAIDTTTQGAFVLDLGSTNGTMVNGQPIKKHLLQNEDVIEIGKYKLHFSYSTPQPKLQPSPTPAATTNPVNAAPAAAPPAAKLKVLNGTNAGKELPLNKPQTTMGRPGVLVISITRNAQGYAVAQVEGATEAKINEQPLGQQVHPLVQGDVIDLAGTRMEFFAN